MQAGYFNKTMESGLWGDENEDWSTNVWAHRWIAVLFVIYTQYNVTHETLCSVPHLGYVYMAQFSAAQRSLC